MADPVLPMLPPLKPGHGVPPLPRRGAWHSLGTADPLQVLARGLDSGDSLHGTDGDIVSVPDVWAQLTVFHNALVVDTHPLHARAVAEWRGLLAAFALGPYRVPGLEAQLIRLSTLPRGRWSDVVTRLPPQAPLSAGEQLDEISLIWADGRLIGFAQALTLVAPSRSLRDDADQRPALPWIADGRISDPLAGSGLSREEREVLVHFLERLCLDLEAEERGHPDLAALLGHSRDYLQEARPRQPLLGLQFDVEPSRRTLPSLPVFNAFRRPERARLSEKSASGCELRLRPGLAGPLRGVILADPSLDERLGRPASEIRVWGHVSLRMLQERPERLEQIRAEAQSAGYLVVTPEDLFLPSLFSADGVGDQSFEQHPVGARGHLLPLSPLLLALTDRASLARDCRIVGSGTGTTVDLQVHFADGGAATLSRHYASEAAAEPPFALAVWPDFQAPWWGLHVGYSGATPSIQFVTGGIVSLAGISRALAATADGFSAVAATRNLLAGDTRALSDATWLREDRQNVRTLFALPGSAEAVALQDRRGGAPRPAGLLLLPEPTPVMARPGAAATVGIDFGTTNTAAYIQLGAQEPEPLSIETRHILPYRLEEQSRDELDAELLPVTRVEMPFQTILRDRLLAAPDQARRPFRDTLIYFAQRRDQAIGKAGDPDLFASLKWSNDQASRERIELYLAQVVILSLAEAAARGVEPGQVTFRFSYPEAFRPEQLRGFQAASRNAVRRGLEAVTPAAPGTPPAREPAFQTESVAAAQYFIHRLRSSPSEGVITFDIGGQTTDVAVVQSRAGETERLAWRGSFQLAGRHMLIDHLRENREVLMQLARSRPELGKLVNSLPAPGKSSDEGRTLATELLVNSPSFADALETVLPTLAGMPDADRLRAVGLAGLAGLFDYAGRTVAHLASIGRFEPRTSTTVSVCIGGRASLLFRALLRSEEEQELLLAFLMSAAGGAVPQARLVFSESPKQEVAYGLVRDDRTLIGGVRSEPLLGEAITAGPLGAEATDLVSAIDIQKPWRIEQPPQFRRFVQKLPSLRIKPVLPDKALGDLIGQANAEVGRLLIQARKERDADVAELDASLIEPPFIVLLRAFVHRLATGQGVLTL